MKKVLIILLSMFLLMCSAFGLVACGGGGDDSGNNPSTERPNNPDDGNGDDSGNGEQTNPPVTETKIAVKAYIDGNLYETIYTTESEGYKIETPTVPDDITTNPNSERYFYGWFVDRNFQTPVTDNTTFRNDSSIFGTWIDVYSNRFEYNVNQGEATITGFNDYTATVVVVPCYLNSFPVTTVTYFYGKYLCGCIVR